MFEHNSEHIKLPTSSKAMSGIYIGTDIWFVSRMQAFDVNNFHLIHCYTCEEAASIIENQSIAPDVILIEFELADHLAQLQQSPALMSCRLLRPLFLLLSEHSLSKKQIEFSNSLAVDDVLIKSTSTNLLFERVCFLNSISQDDCTAYIQPPKARKIKGLKRTFDIIFASFVLTITAPFVSILFGIFKLINNGATVSKVRRVGSGFKEFNLYQFAFFDLSDGKQNRIQDYNKRRNYAYISGAHSCSNCEQLCRPCSPILVIDDKEVCERLFLQLKNNTAQVNETLSVLPESFFVRFIKRSRLHLVPMFINVLKGDISIVGNRPLKVHEAELFTTDQESIRFTAPAGMITLAHSTRKYRESKADLNLIYARNNSFLGDLKILAKSIGYILAPAFLMSIIRPLHKLVTL